MNSQHNSYNINGCRDRPKLQAIPPLISLYIFVYISVLVYVFVPNSHIEYKVTIHLRKCCLNLLANINFSSQEFHVSFIDLIGSTLLKDHVALPKKPMFGKDDVWSESPVRLWCNPVGLNRILRYFNIQIN